MTKNVVHVPLLNTYCCTELNDNLILVTGTGFIKIFSLPTYEIVKSIPSVEVNCDFLVIPDRSSIFIITGRGLDQHSLPDFTLIKKHEPLCSVNCLVYLKSKKRVLFNNRFRLLSLDLSTSTSTKLDDEHKDNILSIVSSADEEFVFTTGFDKTIKQWSTDSWRVVNSVGLESFGNSLLLEQDLGFLLVAMSNGSISEYSHKDLSLIRTVDVTKEIIVKIIRLSSGKVMTCSKNGNILFPYKTKISIKVSNDEINSITELSDKTIVCCCTDGLKILSPSLVDISLIETIDSISSNLDSIRKSTSDKKTQLISLLQHHLTQLISPVEHKSGRFTGLALSLLPDLKSIQRSYWYEGLPVGRRRVLTQGYALEMIKSNSDIPDSYGIMTLFDRKIRLLGKITDENNPIDSFKVEQIRRGKWRFSMQDETLLDHSNIHGSATVHFLNGYLSCYTSDGYIVDRSEFKSTLKVDGKIKEVTSVGNNGVVVTSDRKNYFLNLKANMIDHLLNH